MLATAPTSSTLSKHFLRILYADDLRELRDVARISFSRDGHGIECVEDGLTALRELPFAGKIMVFSSELSNEVAEQYRRLKVDRILYKPVFPSELRKALRELFPDAAGFVPGAQPARPPLAR
jgi:two-component system, chemotaxis family, chemotaxis protein CheY